MPIVKPTHKPTQLKGAAVVLQLNMVTPTQGQTL